uniref:Tetratricopeptide repeat domain 3 n=1 Tax=Homo sapiens TaxID=9606 RepID=A0A8Q3SJJ4_HUMAN
MDNFAEGDFTVADYALLEDCPHVDDCVFAAEFMSNDYVRVTQLYCDGVNLTSAVYGVVNQFLSCKIIAMPLK